MCSVKKRELDQQPQTILFSIEGGGGGFTDQILKFNAFYRLGRSLGYEYVHKNFRVYRSDVFSSQILNLIMQNKWAYGIYRRLFGFDVYSFLAFNSYLNSLSKCERATNAKEIVVGLSDEIIKESGISSAEELKIYVRKKVENQFSSNVTPLVMLRLESSKWRFFKLIFDELTEYPDNINLYKAYNNARNAKPWRSLYKEGKYRVLVHMRQGDTALIQTPWKSYIPVYEIGHSPKEIQNVNDASGIYITTRDYYQFLSKLISHLGDDKFSIVFASDGYRRAFNRLLLNIHRFQFSPTQVSAIRKVARDYDSIDFAQLKVMPNSKLVIGENKNNLKDLIHSALTADVIIAGSQQFMMKKFISTYYESQKQQVFVNLYKGHLLKDQQLFPLERIMRIVNVNLLDYDIEKVAKIIIESLPVLGPVDI